MYVRDAPSRSDALVLARALLSYAEGGLRRGLLWLPRRKARKRTS